MFRIKIDHLGKHFGRLFVVKFSHIENRKAMWFCECECGKTVLKSRAILMTGRVNSCGCLLKEAPSGEKNHSWKGEQVGYRALHQRMVNIIGKQKLCTFCKEEKTLQLANISQKYKTDISDWMWLCIECHSKYDHGWEMINGQWWKNCAICKNYLSVTADNFHKRKTENKRFLPHCKKCTNKISNEKRKKQ